MLTGGAVAASYAALSEDPVQKGQILLPYIASAPAPPPAPPKAVKTTAPKPKPKPKPPVSPPAQDVAPAVAEPANEEVEPPKDNKPAPPEFQPVKILAGSGALYDPSGRGVFAADDPHDPVAAYDDDTDSSWAVTSNGEGDLLVGYVIDLKRAVAVKRVELLTDTPGFRAEIYAANADALPPQVTDTRWAHLKFRDNVDGTSKEDGKPGDGKERITFSDGSQKYRYVLIWFTTPAPTVAPNPPSRTVRLFDLKLFS